ncbi:thiamine pyrophosphate-dependent dehydrogenase E1 component subunit alpha [Nonomuraea sp. KC401]|uniref:thiamine pyrophosphate-dependent dehydrogenase E1 component subunit alpha n=1 Tax=unclassified Nonomuraea TaxID=2593643 RepID=UPI0010FED9DB|nr:MULTISPECIES: thiamine pyrophosphate-dependent dehydrogenase E1 component subunit alpha [unclassified Nonomuraea]NBF00174.1 thiamine pyrophosphate-dependent dehydrogenase E1 component subunit alpha [Nonomuraea sp. K271]TLF53512.1 thiamine pyrophosphate-dependent dehydrogenase E1 component subunit alpha [Nonomuraea sp. KC401]
MDRLSDDDLALLLLIRSFELKLLDLFERGELNGTTHTCLGQEYVPVSLRPLLREPDWVFSNHRGHGHYLARFGDPEGLLAEIMGRKGAVCEGVGGSQHLRRGRYLSTGVQGQSLPVAAGVALRLKRNEPGALACVHIGDGTWGEGSVYEALNLAQLWRLPLLVVVEHNGIAQSTPTALQMAGTIEDRARAFGIAHHHVDVFDLSRIRAGLAPLIDSLRADPRPLIVEFATHRLGPHSKGDDTRPPGFPRTDWYAAYQAAHPAQSARIEAEARARVDEIAADVSARPPATWTTA